MSNEPFNMEAVHHENILIGFWGQPVPIYRYEPGMVVPVGVCLVAGNWAKRFWVVYHDTNQRYARPSHVVGPFKTVMEAKMAAKISEDDWNWAVDPAELWEFEAEVAYSSRAYEADEIEHLGRNFLIRMLASQPNDEGRFNTFNSVEELFQITEQAFGAEGAKRFFRQSIQYYSHVAQEQRKQLGYL